MRIAIIAGISLALASCATAPEPAGGTSSPSSPSATRNAAAPVMAGRYASGPPSGQWQLLLDVDQLPGVSGKVPTQTMSMCSTPEDKKQWQDMVSGKSMAGCTVRDFVADGPSIRYTIECAGGIEGRTVIRIADDDHYGGETMLTLGAGPQKAVIRSNVTATRLAPVCRK